jgi:hypothetical protein
LGNVVLDYACCVPAVPKYVPRKLLKIEAVWGGDPDAETRKPSSLEEAARMAVTAEQNRLACAFYAAKKRYRLTFDQIAEALEVPGDQFWRKVHGDAPASAADLQLWRWAIGDTTPRLASPADVDYHPKDKPDVVWPKI